MAARILAIALVTGMLSVSSAAELTPETLGVETLGEPGAHWFWAHDVAFFNMADARTYLFNADDGEMLGMLSTGIFYAKFETPDGEMQEQLEFVERERLDDFRYVVTRDLGIRYRVGKLPYAYLVDEHGILRTGGLVNSREYLESIFNARELEVGSVQEYLNRQRSNEKHVV